MSKELRFFVLSAVLAATISSAHAVPIVAASFFGPTDTLITFDTYPNVAGTPTSGSALTTQYSSLGVTFSSELAVGGSQATDPGDAGHRFAAGMRVLAAQTGGGRPVSGSRYASGSTYLGTPVSDMRIDFTQPVSAFGLYIIDNDFSTARLQAFKSTGELIETRVVPRVGEGGVAFDGIDAQALGNSISYVILDANNGAALDSTFIDNLYFRRAAVTAAVPEPETDLMMLAGLTLLTGFVRRRTRAR